MKNIKAELVVRSSSKGARTTRVVGVVVAAAVLLGAAGTRQAFADTPSKRRHKTAEEKAQDRAQRDREREQKHEQLRQERAQRQERARQSQQEAGRRSEAAQAAKAQAETRADEQLDAQTQRRTAIAIAVAPASAATSALVASLATDKAAMKGTPRNLYSLNMAEPIKLPTCARPHSFGEALKTSVATTCVQPPLRWGAEAEAPLDRPPTTVDGSDFPGLNITLAEVRLADSEGGRTLNVTLIGGYVVEVSMDFRTAISSQIEKDLRTKFPTTPSNPTNPTTTTCSNGFGASADFPNLLWDFKGMQVDYQPVGKVCEIGGVVGLGFVTFQMGTYRRYLQGIKDRKEAKRPKM